jgi:phage gpG-like protein
MSTLVIQLTTNAAKVVAQIRQFPRAMRTAIATALNWENELTVGHIQRTKLSQRGPTTLAVRTNRLRLSARPSMAVITADGITSSIGSNVVYAGAHEYGVNKTVAVKAHKRRIIALDRYERRGRGFVQTQSGIKGVIRAHSMKMNLPARAMFRTGIEERAPNYSRRISRAIVTAWQGGSPS